MASTRTTENQSLENKQDCEILKEFQKESSCTTSSRQGCYDDGHVNGTEASENKTILSDKVSQNQHSIITTSKMVPLEHNSDCQASENGSNGSKDTYLDKSVSTYLESLNSRLNNLIHLPSGTDKLGEKFEPYNENPGPTSSTENETDFCKPKKVELYGPDVGPKIYDIKGNLVTPPIIAKNLPEAFNSLPIHGKPESNEDIEKFYSKKVREFVGFDLNDEQFENLAKFCSPDHLRTGKELKMTTPIPTTSVLSVLDHKEYDEEDSTLCIVKKHRLRVANDPTNNYQKRLKYRGIRLMPLKMEDDGSEKPPADLDPGKDIIYHVRIYRPFPYNIKEKHVSRHSVFSRDVVVLGRQRLSALRERVVCANDVGARLDAAAAPDAPPRACAKELFPSGFLFVGNVFYVDSRGGCRDTAAPLRAWARRRGLGAFPARDLHATRVRDLHVRLGHPEVYVHQGNCEHLFTFSEIRLLGPEDPLSSTQYPAHTAISQNQSIYCTTCAEFGAKWVVVGCTTVPFDPAYFCETCFKMYLYKDGKKIGDFKAYSYRGNEINMLKPSG